MLLIIVILYLYFFPHTMDLNGAINCLVTHILQNIFFCVQQEK